MKYTAMRVTNVRYLKFRKRSKTWLRARSARDVNHAPQIHSGTGTSEIHRTLSILAPPL